MLLKRIKLATGVWQVDKLDPNKLVNVRTSLNNLKTKVDDLDVAKLNTLPQDLDTSTIKPNDLEKKIPVVCTFMYVNLHLCTFIYVHVCLIHIKQYNRDKQILEKKIEDVDIKISVLSDLVKITNYDAKIFYIKIL